MSTQPIEQFDTRPTGPQQNAEAIPASTLAMWLFLASEAMFFVGLLGSFVVLESAGGQHELFVNSSHMLNLGLGIVSGITLILSTSFVYLRKRGMLWLALVSGLLFLCLQGGQWWELMHHHTYVGHEGDRLLVLDGTIHLFDKPLLLHSVREMQLPNSFDIHSTVSSDIGLASTMIPEEGIRGIQIIEDLNYGPSRNNFFACFFLLSSVHCIHLLVGILILHWFISFRGGKLPDAVQIYWHFVNIVGILGLAVLYFV